MKKDIVVSGSLAYDRIMDFPGLFAELNATLGQVKRYWFSWCRTHAC